MCCCFAVWLTYQIGEYNKSHEFYERAYDLMSLEERESVGIH